MCVLAPDPVISQLKPFPGGTNVTVLLLGPPSGFTGRVWVQPAGWAPETAHARVQEETSVHFGYRHARGATQPCARPPCLPAARGTSGWNAWHVSGRRRSFWDRIRSHFTEALCARLSRTP